jgi:predicted CXXCH cytochrome family protein
MEALLREWRRGKDNEYTDRIVTTDVITIGRAPECTIQLLDAAVADDHARIRRTRRGFVLEARGRSPVKFHDTLVKRTARLEVGDTLDICGNQIALSEPPAGFDLALIVKPAVRVQQADPESAFQTRLEQTWLSRRQLSWLLFLVTPLITFVIPLQIARLRTPLATGSPVCNPTAEQPTSNDLRCWLPDDSLWSAGPLSPAHALRFNGQCRACHRDFFVHVRDEDCRACHVAFSDDHVSKDHRIHAPTPLQSADRAGNPVAALNSLLRGWARYFDQGPLARPGDEDRPCRTCHEEHKSDSGSIVVRNNALCVTCHTRPELVDKVKLVRVSGFSGERAHPSFTATVLRVAHPGIGPTEGCPKSADAAGIVPTVWQCVRVPVAAGREQSNLSEYSHKLHLDAVQMRRALGCSDCHVLGLDGQHFKPVTMAVNCMTANCHELTFDKDAPRRQLPHGKPQDAVLMIEDYYARKYSDPRAAAPVRLQRRLPDKPEPEEHCQGRRGPALGECFAREEAILQLNTTIGCKKCHIVDDRGESIALEDRFAVHPVRFNANYFPRASFSHRQHLIQEGKTGGAACLSCHPADQSEDITRLMLPDRDRCLKCHADLPVGNRVQLQCTSCHTYHLQR